MERNGPQPAANALLLAVVALVGLNLRPFITGVGPLATAVSAGTGLGLQGMALLTLVPMLLMGVFAFAGPSMQAKVGARRSVVAALAVLTLGSFLRLFVATGWQMVGTAALLGLGAAIVQAVFPGIVKQQFPRHVGLVMGLYSAMLMGGARSARRWRRWSREAQRTGMSGSRGWRCRRSPPSFWPPFACPATAGSGPAATRRRPSSNGRGHGC
jgi:cyanate permease